MDSVKAHDSCRIMKAEMRNKPLPNYMNCPKCNRKNQLKETKGIPTHKINYKGTYTCSFCRKSSTLAEWHKVVGPEDL